MRDIGLWGPTIRDAYEKLGVLEMANVDLGALMAADERAADDLDREREQVRAEADLAARQAEVAETIAEADAGAGSDPDARQEVIQALPDLPARASL
jgi:hypothetical protein